MKISKHKFEEIKWRE